MATAIRIGNPASWHLAEEARAESGGLIDSVTDEQILAAYRMLAQREGVFGEPASAAGVAGLLRRARPVRLRRGSTVVCTITGHGLKDPDTAVSGAPPAVTIGVDLCGRRRPWACDDGRPGVTWPDQPVTVVVPGHERQPGAGL